MRVKRKASPQVILSPLSEKTSNSLAPLLTPGAYDADALLQHRQRSASAASAEAVQEWARTGGTFARVSSVRASREAELAAAQNSVGTESALHASDLVSPPESPRNVFGRASGIGVEGALGYFDTDAEDSGAESGRNSPEVGRKSNRKGFGGGALGFTPVSTTQGSTMNKSLGLSVGSSNILIEPMDRSPRSNDSVTSSWIQLDQSSNEEISSTVAGAVAADLEPAVSLM